MVKLKPKPTGKRKSKDKPKDIASSKKKSNGKKILKKRIIFKNKLSFKKKSVNPSITRFNINSYFFYDIDEINKYLSTVSNKNFIKVNNKELDYLNQKIQDLDLLKECENSSKFISIKKNVLEKIRSFIKIKEMSDPLTKFIKNKMEKPEIRNLLSCRKLAKMYEQETGIKTNRTTINKIIKYKLGYHYRKTTLKNPKINLIKNKLISFCFIKIIIRCICLGFRIIYIDESSITNKNCNLRCFKKENEKINFKYDKLFKSNLIMAIDSKSVIYYEICDKSTNENIFFNFIKKLITKLKNDSVKNFVLVLDNLSCHKTPSMKQLFLDNKINVLFNSPYMSEWNCIELAFRALKRKYYHILFETKEEQVCYIKQFLENKEFSKTLEFNYCETLKEYRKFIINNENINLNIIKN